MKQRRMMNIIKHYLDGDEYYTIYSPRISKTEIGEVEKTLDVIFQIDHTYGANAGPIAVYPLKKDDFKAKAIAYLQGNCSHEFKTIGLLGMTGDIYRCPKCGKEINMSEDDF
jgi:hypothetical protein